MIHSVQENTSDIKAPISLRMIGINHHQEPIKRTKGLPLYQWFYCVKGKGEFILHNQKYVLSAGEGALIYPNESHAYHSLTDNWTLHFVGFSGSMCAELLKQLRMPESNVYHFNNQDIFPMHMQNLEYLYQRTLMNYNMELSKEVYSFLLDLSTSISRITAFSTASENAIVQRIISYLENHYADAFSLTALADEMQLSKEYLCVIFKKEMRQTILQHLLSIRISHARIFLIQHPEKRSYEIGQMCGFDSPNYFIKVFRKFNNCTPEEYRMLH